MLGLVFMALFGPQCPHFVPAAHGSVTLRLPHSYSCRRCMPLWNRKLWLAVCTTWLQRGKRTQCTAMAARSGCKYKYKLGLKHLKNFSLFLWGVFTSGKVCYGHNNTNLVIAGLSQLDLCLVIMSHSTHKTLLVFVTPSRGFTIRLLGYLWGGGSSGSYLTHILTSSVAQLATTLYSFRAAGHLFVCTSEQAARPRMKGNKTKAKVRAPHV